MKNLNNYIDSIVKKTLKESLEERAETLLNKIKSKVNEIDDDMGANDGWEEISMDEEMEEGETCEQCGGNMNEGQCNECGYGGMMESTDMDFDPSEKLERVCNEDGEDYDAQACESHKRYAGAEMTEALFGGQKKMDKNKNNKIDAEDFKMLRKSKKHQTDEEMEEGNAFTGALAKAKRKGDDDFEVDGKEYQVKESIKLTEDEMIDMIEKIVREEKDNIKKMSKPKGLATYETAIGKSKKENDDYIKSVTQKMKDYLKNGSKEDYTMDAEHFPESNGQMDKKMAKKTYQASDAVDEYVEAFSSAGQENLMYDEIHPNEDWVTDNIEGSSRTGNNPKWANAVETPVNKNRNKIRKDNLLGALKKQAYNKSPQPVVTDEAGEVTNGGRNTTNKSNTKANKIMNQLESTQDKKTKLLNEEINKMSNLLNYNRKTQ
jgi:hypothetical protein